MFDDDTKDLVGPRLLQHTCLPAQKIFQVLISDKDLNIYNFKDNLQAPNCHLQHHLTHSIIEYNIVVVAGYEKHPLEYWSYTSYINLSSNYKRSYPHSVMFHVTLRPEVRQSSVYDLKPVGMRRSI